MKKITTLFLLFIYAGFNAQVLKPGFDKAEYIDLMKVSARFGSSNYYTKIGAPVNYDFVYRSPVVGIENCWDLWVSKDHKVAVASIRGTTEAAASWLANFYSAMVPAKGTLQLSKTDTFHYELASDPKAAVHIGWLVGTAYLAKDILPKIDSCYKSGIKDVVIFGHSQGGGIAYLLTAYLLNLQYSGKLPSDIQFKTYCSAGPKPGNLFFAYEYEAMTQNGWAFNVVNTADWVPEVPFSVQTINDFNGTNPFKDARKVIRKQKFPVRFVMKRVYKKLDKPTRKAQRNFQKYLGNMAAKALKKGTLKEYTTPDYYKSNNYVRTGNTIVLTPDEEYYKKYPYASQEMFMHHYHGPYIQLAEKLKFRSEYPAEK